MWESRGQQVLLAVDSADCAVAVTAAADEARARSTGVHVVHVGTRVGSGLGDDAEVIELREQAHRQARALVSAVALQVDKALGAGGAVSSEVCWGAVVDEVVRLSRTASLVVVEHREPSPRHTPSMSLAAAVAARSGAPTLVVPAAWDDDRLAGHDRVVTAGVDLTGFDGEVVRAALEEAAWRRARLRLVHGWSADLHPHPWALSEAAVEVRNEELRSHLLVRYAAELSSRPDITVGIEVSGARPLEILRAEPSALLVVGRRHLEPPLGSHLGPVALPLLRLAACPVLVVDPAVPHWSSDVAAEASLTPGTRSTS